MTFIGARALLEMQNCDPRKLIRGRRAPIFAPWKPAEPVAGGQLFVSTSSDLSNWRPMDRRLLELPNTIVRLQRPGSLTQQEVMALKGAETIWVDVFAGDEAVCSQMLEAILEHLPTINDYVM